MMYDMMIKKFSRPPLRTTVNIDDELLTQAQTLTGIRERATLMRMALEALIEREAARRLARLGGTEPDIEDVPRRRARR